LSSAVTKRLYRYLDKHFWYRSKISINLFTLCHEKLGVSRNYKYQSMLRQQLDPAAEELIKRGFLSEVQYSGKASGTEVHFVSKSRAPRNPSLGGSFPVAQTGRVADLSGNSESNRGAQTDVQANSRMRPEMDLERGESDAPSSRHDSQFAQQCMFERLLETGLSESHARSLLHKRSLIDLERMQSVLDYVHERYLKPGAPRKVTNPAGLVFRALKDPFAFELPDDKRRSVSRTADDTPNASSAIRADRKTQKMETKESFLRRRYEGFLAEEITRLRNEIDESMLMALRTEVSTGMKNMRTLISTERFEQATEHAINNKLLKLFAVQSYEDWLREVISAQRS
jgi:hypothetical protein